MLSQVKQIPHTKYVYLRFADSFQNEFLPKKFHTIAVKIGQNKNQRLIT